MMPKRTRHLSREVRCTPRVSVVMVASDRTATSVNGLVVGLPSQAGSSGQVSVSIEMAAGDAGAVAAAEKVRLVLLDPGATG
jgi:hypothetical protein